MRLLLALWIRLHRLGAVIGSRRAAIAAAYRERFLAEELSHLDTRTLKDIGLESWRSALGARVERHRMDTLRWSAARLGMY